MQSYAHLLKTFFVLSSYLLTKHKLILNQSGHLSLYCLPLEYSTDPPAIFRKHGAHLGWLQIQSACPQLLTPELGNRLVTAHVQASSLFQPIYLFLLSVVGQQHVMQNYHRMMNVILDDLVKCQNTDGIVTSIIVDNTPCGVTLKVPVAFVVGDCEGNDKLCGRFGTHSLGNILVCRDCDCPTMQADNPGVVCSPITIQTIFSARDDLVALKLLSHHNIDNAFHKLSFGGDPEGIHGCSPPEMLHLYQQGFYKYALESFVNSLTSEQRRSLDQLVAKVSDNCYHQSDRTFPRFRFAALPTFLVSPLQSRLELPWFVFWPSPCTSLNQSSFVTTYQSGTIALIPMLLHVANDS